MLSIGTITLFPEMFTALNSSIVGRAQQQRLLQLHFWNPREFTTDPQRRVDERPFGGGPGMIMKYQPLAAAIKTAKHTLTDEALVIYLSPQGQPLTQTVAQQLSQRSDLILIAGRYEGIDERLIEDHTDKEISIGDYVLSGGELPAMVLIDTITRLLPGALGHKESAKQDSFTRGLLEHPHYTRPEHIDEKSVPKVLLSGHHQAISDWRLKQALGRTWQRRQDLLKRVPLTKKEQHLLTEFIAERDEESS